MQRQHDRILKLCQVTVDKLKLKDNISVDLSGPVLVMIPNGNGPGQPAVVDGWNVMLTITHTKLLNQEPLAAKLPVPGLLPEDEFFVKICTMLLEALRQKRHEMETEPVREADAIARLRGKQL